MQLPTLHLNGTSKERLLEQNLAAVAQVREAINSLVAAAPHPRDYPKPGIWIQAHVEYIARLQLLHKVLDELETLALGIDNGGHQEQP